MKHLTKSIFTSILTMLCAISVNAQTTVKLTKDLELKEKGVTLHKGTKLTVCDKIQRVRVTGVPEKNPDNNIQGCVVVGSIFDITRDNNDLKKVHFTDSAGVERYSIKGVTLERDSSFSWLATYNENTIVIQNIKLDQSFAEEVYDEEAGDDDGLNEGTDPAPNLWRDICHFCVKYNLHYLIFIFLFLGLILFMTKYSNREKLPNEKETPKGKEGKGETDNNGVKNQPAQNQEVTIEDIKNVISLLQQVSEMKPKFDKLEKKLAGQDSINELTKQLEESKSTIANKDITISQKETELREKVDEITKLTQQIESLNNIGNDVIMLSGHEQFTSESISLLQSCQQAENIIQQYVKSLNGEDLRKASYFLARYIQDIPTSQRDKWTSVLSTLAVKGYVKGDEVSQLKSLKNDKEKINYLKKHSVEDLWRSYISALLIMLDEMRCAKKFGLSQNSKEAETAITAIKNAAKKLEFEIDDVSLFNPYDGQADSVELPSELKQTDLSETNIVNFIYHIAVNCKEASKDKTKYYMPI